MRHQGEIAMKSTLVTRLWEAFRVALGRIVRATLIGLVVGFVFVEALAALLNRTAGDPAGITLTWPPVISFAPITTFVHITAILFALMLAYLFGFSVAVKETFQGVIYAAEHVDDAIATVANDGLNLADAVVDAVDGPNRHGFLGRRGPTRSH
jgi:hypothetical protein